MKTRFYHRRELLTAARQVETLSKFRIDQIGARFVVIETLRNGEERRACVRTSEEAAIDYLFNKLPCIESEM